MPLVLAPLPPSSQSTLSMCNSTTSSVLEAPTTPTSPSLDRSHSSMSASQNTKVSTYAADVVNLEKTKEESPRFPTATLDAESISDVMAARLATCLLGHVLYLKSQVPFPVAQLMRMTSVRKADERTAKKQDTLLSTFDLLSSHLGTTFTALSVALAHTQLSSHHIRTNSYSTENASRSTVTAPATEASTATTHLAIILGPTVTSATAARARVILEFDGLRIQQRLSVREEEPSSLNTGRARPRLSLNGHLKENNYFSLSADLEKDENARTEPDENRRFGADPSFEGRNTVLRDVTRRDDESDESEEDEGEVQEDDDVRSVPSESESDFDTDEDYSSDSDSYFEDEANEIDLDAPKEECEADLLAAERLLSRTLAIANADPEQGMAAELRPTQTHILLRAPRCFVHPAWIPRPNLSRDMDIALQEFNPPNPPDSSSANGDGDDSLTDITNGVRGAKPPHAKATNGKPAAGGRKTGLRTECVRVRCRAGTTSYSEVENHKNRNEGMDDEVQDDEDEMIWWSWDGRLEGFVDW